MASFTSSMSSNGKDGILRIANHRSGQHLLLSGHALHTLTSTVQFLVARYALVRVTTLASPDSVRPPDRAPRFDRRA